MNKQQLASKIWESANNMRSKIEANEYKDYILGFIFYKFLSEKEEERLRADGYDDDSLKEVNEDDRDVVKYCKDKLGYFIPYEYLFSTWLQKGSDFDVSNVRDGLNSFNRNIDENYSKVFEKIFDKRKTFVCNVVASFTYNIKTTDVLPLKSDIFAMCAIGQPEQFYDFVRQKSNLLDTITFDDHHQYKYSEVAKLHGNIVTTEKDAVKLAEFDLDNIYALKLKLELDVESILK